MKRIEWRLLRVALLTEGDVDLPKLESGMYFLQVKASMSMKKKPSA